MSFGGLRIVALESRRADALRDLVRAAGGDPYVAPSVRERPLKDNGEAVAFLDRLDRGDFDMCIFTTGAGVRCLRGVAEAHERLPGLVEGLAKLVVVSRGPKPVAALREAAVGSDIVIPEPNTWRELLDVVRDRSERRIAVQEYGAPATDLIEGLRELGAEVTSVKVYRWDLPEELAPLKEAVRRIVVRQCEVVLFTSSVQLEHMLRVAEDLGLREEALKALKNDIVIASIGPVMSDSLRCRGLEPDFEPKRPKMAIFVRQTAARAMELLTRKKKRRSNAA